MANKVHITVSAAKPPTPKMAKDKSPLPAAVQKFPDQPAKISDKQIAKENASYAKRRATDRWVSGGMTTKEHEQVHARANHVLTGKPIRAFKGKSGENKRGGWI